MSISLQRTANSLMMVVAVWSLTDEVLLGQSLDRKSAMFDAASVKISHNGGNRTIGGGPGANDPSQYRARSVTLLDLMGVAYHMRPFQILSRIPLDHERFDVFATIATGTSRDEFRIMMQNLLAERFSLKSHLDSREFPAFEMTVSKSGAKIRESKADGVELSQAPKRGADGFPVLPARERAFAGNSTFVDGYVVNYYSFQQQTLSALVDAIQIRAGLPIVDHTGLAGEYDFRLTYSIEPRGSIANTPAPVPELFKAVQEQLGLLLKERRLPFDVVIVDSVNLVPREN